MHLTYTTPCVSSSSPATYFTFIPYEVQYGGGLSSSSGNVPTISFFVQSVADCERACVASSCYMFNLDQSSNICDLWTTQPDAITAANFPPVNTTGSPVFFAQQTCTHTVDSALSIICADPLPSSSKFECGGGLFNTAPNQPCQFCPVNTYSQGITTGSSCIPCPRYL